MVSGQTVAYGRAHTKRGLEQRVTPLEIFFDLVFVFSITQVVRLMARDPTAPAIGRGLIVLAVLWWAWTGYAWLTNALEPEDSLVRAGMFAGMGAMLLAALAVPSAFGQDAALFGVAYVIVRMINLALFAIPGRSDPEFRRALYRSAPTTAIGSILILVAAFTEGWARITLWILAIGVAYASALVVGRLGWLISVAHFAERYGLVVIIALGESILVIGIATAGVDLGPAIIATAGLGLAVIAALWWAYFDVVALLAERELSRIDERARVRLARDYYAYLHLPMIAGIVLFALGLELALHHVMEPMATVPSVALCGGLSLFFSTQVIMRIRLVAVVRRTSTDRPHWIGPGRVAAATGTFAVIPAAKILPVVATLSLIAVLNWALIVWDVLRYREQRVEVREARR